MSIFSMFAIYFIMWWMTLFAVLPWGVKSAEEAGEVMVEGQASSAPVNPMIGRKLIATTLVSAIIFAIGYWLINSGILSLDSFPFVPDFKAL